MSTLALNEELNIPVPSMSAKGGRNLVNQLAH